MKEIDYAVLNEVLLWITGIGAPVIIGYVLSLLAENFPAWHDLPRAVKFMVPLLGSVGLSAGAHVLLGYPDVIAQIAPWWNVLATSVLVYLGSQKAYIDVKKSGYGVKRE